MLRIPPSPMSLFSLGKTDMIRSVPNCKFYPNLTVVEHIYFFSLSLFLSLSLSLAIQLDSYFVTFFGNWLRIDIRVLYIDS